MTELLTGKTFINLMRAFSLVCVCVWASLSFAGSDYDSAVAERITPFGKVCVEGEECEGATVAASAAAGGGEPRSGEEVYQAACLACHGTGAAGAPKLNDVAAWAPRLEKGLETLIANGINGINGMPPMGACGACSEAEIEAAVVYMVDNSQ